MINRTMKQVSKVLNSTVSTLTFNPGKTGDVYGLELELEGRGVMLDEVPTKGWKRVKDGSLRGENIEYVFTAPCALKVAEDRVNNLFNLFTKAKVKLNNSYRTSTHVHINFADRKLREVINFFCLFTIVEEVLEAFCGELRIGNLFCLSSRDVEPLVNMLEQAVERGDLGAFGEDVRYCAINLSALNKFGSIEIRTMRGADNAELVIDWLNICDQLKKFATDKMESPVRLIESLSFLGDVGFLQQVFDRKTVDLLLASWGKRDLHSSLYTGARLVQLLAYRLEEAYQIPFDPKDAELEAAKEGEADPALCFVMLRNDIHTAVPLRRPVDRAEFVTEEGVVLQWYSVSNKWADKYGGAYVDWCDFRGRKRPVCPYPEPANIAINPARIQSFDGRVWHVPARPADEERVPGIHEKVLFDAMENYWYDWENHCYLPYYNVNGRVALLPRNLAGKRHEMDQEEIEDADDEDDDDFGN